MEITKAAEGLQGLTKITFDTIENAVNWAKLHGGLIAQTEKEIIWYDATVWNMTPIMMDIRGNARIATWPTFAKSA